MVDVIEEFGHCVLGARYRLRPGGYVILRNDAGYTAVIVIRGGVFLPGGGQNRGETPEAAAVREALEECGLIVRLNRLVGVADELVYGEEERTYFRKRCSFYAATVLDHDAHAVAEQAVLWMRPQEAVALLAHNSQRWAVKRAFGLASDADELPQSLHMTIGGRK